MTVQSINECDFISDYFHMKQPFWRILFSFTNNALNPPTAMYYVAYRVTSFAVHLTFKLQLLKEDFML